MVVRETVSGIWISKLFIAQILEFDESRNTQYVSNDDSLHIRVMKITLDSERLFM